MRNVRLVLGLFLLASAPLAYSSEDNFNDSDSGDVFADSTESEDEDCICENEATKNAADEQESYNDNNFNEKDSRRKKMNRDRKFKKPYKKKLIEEKEDLLSAADLDHSGYSASDEDKDAQGEEEGSQENSPSLKKKKKCECVRVDKKIKRLRQYNNQKNRGKTYSEKPQPKMKRVKQLTLQIPDFMVVPLVIGQFGIHSHH